MIAKSVVEFLTRRTYKPPVDPNALMAEIKDALAEQPPDITKLHTLARAAIDIVRSETNRQDLNTPHGPWARDLGNYAAQCLIVVTNSRENW